MAHPSDAALHLTLGRDIEQIIRDKIERLIRKPDERTAGYIDALRDVQRMMNGGDLPDLDYRTTHPPQEI